MAEEHYYTPGGMTSLRIKKTDGETSFNLTASSDGMYMFSFTKVEDVVELHRELMITLTKLQEFGLYSPMRGK